MKSEQRQNKNMQTKTMEISAALDMLQKSSKAKQMLQAALEATNRSKVLGGRLKSRDY
jgi:hypothetical protein